MDFAFTNQRRFFDADGLLAMPAYVLVFLLAAFPMVPALSLLKEGLFVVLLLTVGGIALLTGRLRLHPAVLGWTFFLSALSFFFVMRGFFAGAVGAHQTASIYVIWPLVYGFVIAGVLNKRILMGLASVMVASTIFLAIYSQFYLLTKARLLPGERVLELLSFGWKPERFQLGEGYIFMQYPGLNSLPFLVPFALAALIVFLPHAQSRPPLKRMWLWMAALLGILAVPMTGRRALFLVTLTAPVLTLVFISFQPSQQRRLSRKALFRVTGWGVLAAVAAVGCLRLTYGFDFSSLGQRFSAGFTFRAGTGDKGAAYRREQFHALLDGWTESPLLGAGHGASAYGSIRSKTAPWEYELYYLALLYQTGIVGFAAYGAGVFWIYWMGVRIIRAGGDLSALSVACLVGLSSFLIANATNPYLPGLDGILMIFFPLALINFWMARSANTPLGATQVF
jgi:hypothetical protein